MNRFFLSLLILLLPILPIFSEEGIRVKVIDAGAGLACIIEATNSQGKKSYAIYDTGNNKTAFEEMKKFSGNNKKVDFLIISHVDTDHLRSTKKVVDHYEIKNILHTGFIKTKNTSNWEKAITAINEEIEDGAKEYNQLTKPMAIGNTFDVGPAKFTLLSGFGKYPDTWEAVPDSEALNAVSIVLKLEYKDSSILFAGDAVGRHEDNDDKHTIATEKYLIKNNSKPKRSIKANVLIAPHHGGNDCNSYEFIGTVSPKHVIFSAGSQHRHPNLKAVNRYIKWAKTEAEDKVYLYRTDYGDNEKRTTNKQEWKIKGAIGGDEKGDDHINIKIDKDGKVFVDYEPGSDGKKFDAATDKNLEED